MKFTDLFQIAAVGLLVTLTASSSAVAGPKKAHKEKETNVFKLIDSDLRSFDKAVFGSPKKEKVKAHKKHKKHYSRSRRKSSLG
jgi:hypothetical protein